MALPTVFANLSAGNQPIALLDTTLNALGAMGVQACTATGTNIITLTPAANQTTVAAYANYLLFGFVAANSTGGAVTLLVGALAALPVYRIDGTQAGSGDITAGVYYIVAYNSALNAGGGGFALVGANKLPASATFAAINGLLPSAIVSTNSTTCTITISAGQATDSTNATVLAGGSFSWSVANGNAANGFQSGTTLPNSTTIHFYICNGASGTTSFASTSLTPTLPTGYTTYYRRIFSLFTDTAGRLLGTVGNGASVTEIMGGGLLFWYTTQILDVNQGATSTTTRFTYTLSLPTGIVTAPQYRFVGSGSGAGGASFILTGSGETDVVASTISNNGFGNTAPGFDSTNLATIVPISAPRMVLASTSGQIGIRNANGTNVTWNLVTSGFIDFRRS